MFEGLLPEPHNTVVTKLLFCLAEWHALARLWFHTESTIFYLRSATTILGKQLHQFRYATKELKIKYDGSSDAGLIGYSDSDWGENGDDCHSTSGHVFLMANGAISWASQRQKMVTLSVGEAEYMELASTG